jgi:hypothetical protein
MPSIIANKEHKMNLNLIMADPLFNDVVFLSRSGSLPENGSRPVG